MATNLIVLGLNAARLNVKVNPNMTILKVLELACAKMKIDSNDYDLKYHNKILDTTSLIRFTNIANNALLELVPATKSRQNSSVVIWLQIEDGTRFSGEFLSSQNLLEVVQTLLNDRFTNYESPAIIYTRMEIIGKDQLQQKTLKDIGLVGGKALLRLLNKKESEVQAHVYIPSERKPKIEESPRYLGHGQISETSSSVQSSNLIKQFKNRQQQESMDIELNSDDKTTKTEPINKTVTVDKKKKPVLTDKDLSDFKNSITYLDGRYTLLFNIVDGTSVMYQDEDDDFFEPTVKDVTLVLRDLKNARSQLEDGQLCTSEMRKIEKTQNKLTLISRYRKCIIRIHFPDRLVLQTVFESMETVLDIIKFIRKYLVDESLEFTLFTTPPKTILRPEDMLFECEFIPSAMIHFSCGIEANLLKPDIKEKIVSGCQASIAAYIIRKEVLPFRSRIKLDEHQPGPSHISNYQTHN